MKILTVAQMVAMEQMTHAAGFTYDQMMAAAGAALARVIQAEIDAFQAPAANTVLFLIGPGNNGGDGLVACAHLQRRGVTAIPYIWRRKHTGDPLLAGVEDVLWAEQDPDYLQLQAWLSKCHIVVDALLGTGSARSITGSLAELLAVVHKRLAHLTAELNPELIIPAQAASERSRLTYPRVITCDCPSGLNCDTGDIDPLALAAAKTVTFAHPKVGHLRLPGALACGQLLIADIGIDRKQAPTSAPELLTPASIAALLPARPASAHKGAFGRALIVAGSVHYPGAAGIACAAAYRAGAGLVHLATTAEVGQIVASQLPEPIHTALPASAEGALALAAAPVLASLLPAHDALVIGPGLGGGQTTVAFVKALLAQSGSSFPPTVVDADGLNALAQIEGGPGLLSPGNILTPHPGEFARLTGLDMHTIQDQRWELARRFAQVWNQIVVLKGAFTVIAHPNGALAVSPFAEPALATAGSGDVLAGILAGLLAQGVDAWAAAQTGVYLHALAGVLAARTLGPALLASDISRFIPQALHQLTR